MFVRSIRVFRTNPSRDKGSRGNPKPRKSTKKTLSKISRDKARMAKFGPEYSSDNAGDGPKSLAKKIRQKLKKASRKVGGAMLKTGVSMVGQQAENVGLPSSLVNKIEKKVNRAIDKKIVGSGLYRGRGAYEMNKLMAGSDHVPETFLSVGDETGDIIITRKEYITDIFSPIDPGGFNNTTYSVNPGLQQPFVWLSQIAPNYTEYRFEQLVFEYRPVISSTTLSGAMGTIIAAFNYNAAAVPFVNKVQMNEYDAAKSFRPCDALRLGVECDRSKMAQGTLFTRAGNVPIGQDIKTYDVGTFQIATYGLPDSVFPTGTQLGELWVYYTVRLSKPQLYDSLGYAVPRDSFFGKQGDAILPFGPVPYKSRSNKIGGVLQNISTGAAQQYIFPDNFQGYVRVLVFGNDNVAGGSGLNWTVTIFGNIETVPDLSVTFGSADSQCAAVGPQYFMRVIDLYVYRPTAGGTNLIQFAVTGLSSPLDVAWLDIIQYNTLLGPMASSGTTPSNYVPAF